MSEKVMYEYEGEEYRSRLVQYELDCFEVITERLRDNGDWDVVNNTGAVDNYPEAFYYYQLDLDCFNGVTFEESEEEN